MKGKAILVSSTSFFFLVVAELKKIGELWLQNCNMIQTMSSVIHRTYMPYTSMLSLKLFAEPQRF